MKLLRMIYRQAKRNRLISVVNLFGLIISTCVLLLLSILVINEIVYDRPVPNSEQLVLIGSHGSRTNGQQYNWPIISAGVPVDLQQQVPGIESFVRTTGDWETERAFSRADKQILAPGAVVVDSTFFDVTGIPLVQGSTSEALAHPNSAVITRSFANLLFGDEDPIGQEFVYRGNSLLTVTGVIERMPRPSMFADMQVLISWVTSPDRDDRDWNSQINHYCLLQLEDGLTVEDIRPSVEEVTQRYFSGDRARPGYTFELTLVPLRDVHLHGHYDPNFIQTGRLPFVLQFAAIGVFLLLITTLNFVNLVTAQSIRRGVYVGIVKTLGATRSQLMLQFISETVILVSGSVLAGSLLAIALLPAFSLLVDVDLSYASSNKALLVVVAVIAGILYSILMGILPALILSGIGPIKALRKAAITGKRGARLRSVLVVLQFSIAAGLVISSMVVLRQINYIRTADIGFDREHVLVIRLGNWDLMTSYDVLYEQFRNKPFVVSASTADHLPIQSGNTSSYHVPGTPEDERVYLSTRCVDHDYLQTLGMRLVAGRNFDPDRATDSVQAVIINETAARELGLGDNPVGRTFESIYNWSTRENVDAEIIGVVEDYQSQSMKDGIDPIFLRIYTGFPPWLIFRLQPGTEREAINELEGLWTDFAPGIPLQYSFLDERFDALYRSEQRLSALFRLFTGVALVIAGLGLFALSAFSTERRTKEIGVRKVLGAQVSQVVTLLVGDFIKLVIVGNLVAWPVAGWLMHKWLNGYAFRTDLEWWLFAATFGVSVLLALVTVSVHAIRASLANPVKALRDE